MIRVPAIHRGNLGRALFVGYASFCLLYLGAGFTRLGSPTILTGSAWDAAVPFVEWSIWIYVSQFALLPLAFVLARDDLDRHRAYYASLAATAIAAVVFVAWPTQIARPAIVGEDLTAAAWRLLYSSDVPGNCFPSLHVALSVIAGTVLWRSDRRLVALLWPGLIAVSTLTTRQHVLLDVAAGAALAIACWSLAPRFARHDAIRSHSTARA
jgi:membrane-associated phospholipid phosphatase